MTEEDSLGEPGPMAPDPQGRGRRVATIMVLVALSISIVGLAFVSGRGVITAPEITTSPTPSPGDSGVMAIVDADGRLTTTDGQGGSSVGYGSPATVYAFPAWSPDGTRIAVLGQDGADRSVAIFTVAPDGSPPSDPVVVYHDPDRPPFYLYWSPDGREVAFLTTESDGLALRVAPADGSAEATVIHQGSPLYWAWTGPERVLIHSGGDGASAFVGETDIDGGRSSEPATPSPGGFRVPAISPDGILRGYTTSGATTPSAVVVEAADGTRRLSVDVFGTAAIEFSPVSDDLALLAPDGPIGPGTLPIGPLRILDGSTGDVRTVLGGPIIAFVWSPDGRTIAALQLRAIDGDSIAQGGEVQLAASTSERVTPARAGVVGLTSHLVFVDAASGNVRSERDVTVSDLFAGQIIPYFDQYALSHRLWSADSASLTLPLVEADESVRVTVISADGSGSRELPTGAMGFWRP